jgi:tRNA pseudouridine38-40 synthase
MNAVRWRLTVSYDGRAFRGWQSQRTRDSVQDVLEAALAAIAGRRVVVHGSGRTDAGVHALGQVAHVDLPAKHSAGTWRAAINAHLPAEVRVLAVRRAPADFHARFSARGKVYEYRIWNHEVHHPLELGRSWHVPHPIDLNALRSGANEFCGTHDFAAFAANRGKPERTTMREISSVTIRRAGPLLRITFAGEGFLYKMVRLMTGMLVQCARGRTTPEAIRELLKSPSGRKTNYVAPAEGLYLKRVIY